jgi:hypothetical protein
MSSQTAKRAGARFLKLVAADRILFEAAERLRELGMPEYVRGMEPARARISRQLAKVQRAAYTGFGRSLAKSKTSSSAAAH